MIICPILSQQRRAEDGSVTWEHHECLRDGCAFWAAEAEDCTIRASRTEILREIAAQRSEPPAPPIDPASILEQPLARLTEMEKKMESLSERGAASSRDLGLRLLEGVAALEQPVNALREEMDRIQTKMQETTAVLERALAVIEDHRRREEEREGGERIDEARECNARGMALCHREMYEAAETAFGRAIELDPGMAEAHNNLGIALSRLGRSDEAAAAFEKALGLRPDLASAMNNLGYLCHESMEFEKAADLFRRAALKGTDASIAYTNLGNALYRQDRRSEAVEAWKRALETDPLNENAARSLRMFEGAEA